MEEVFNRVLEVIEYYSIDIKPFCLKIGFGYSTFINYSNSLRKPNNLDLYLKVLNTFEDISAEWLMRGEGEMIKKSTGGIPDGELIKMINDMRKEIISLAKENGKMTSKIEIMSKQYSGLAKRTLISEEGSSYEEKKDIVDK